MIETLLAVLSSNGITAMLTWMVTRKKQKAEAAFSELQNVEKAITIWRELASDLSVKLESLNAKCEELTGEISVLRAENRLLKKGMEKLGKSIDTTVK